MAFDLTSLEVAAAISVVGIATYVTRLYFDARDAWWKRTEWALDKAISEGTAESVLGLSALDVLTKQRLLMRRGDRTLLEATIRTILNDVEPPMDEEST